MSSSGSPVTVGVDIGTTSVKALAVDEKGQVVARSRVPHSIVAPEPDVLRHDAKKAWRAGPRKAFEQVTAQLEAEGNSLAGVAVASMVPSMTAVGRQGVPVAAGPALRGPRGPARRGRAGDDAVVPLGAMPDAEGFLRWASTEVPDARGYWPCQAVATNAISGLPAIDTGVTASLGMLHTHKGWNTRPPRLHGHCREADADGRPDGRGRRHAARQRRRHHGRDHRRLLRPDRVGRHPQGRCPGHLRRHPDLLGDLRRVADHRRADQLPEHDAGPVSSSGVRATPAPSSSTGPGTCCGTRHVPGRSASSSSPGSGHPAGFRSGCPTCGASARRSRTTRCAPTSTASTSGRAPKRWSGPPTRPAGSWCGG